MNDMSLEEKSFKSYGVLESTLLLPNENLDLIQFSSTNSKVSDKSLKFLSDTGANASLIKSRKDQSQEAWVEEKGLCFSDENMISSTQESETTRRNSRKNAKPSINSKKCADGHSGSEIIRGHEIKPVDRLLNLEKKPLECYFEGLKGKPSRRRKIRQPKNKCLDFLEPDSSAVENEGWISTLSGAPPKVREQNEVEDRLLGSMTHMKMKTYERIKEYKQKNISMKQRLAEKSYLEQQENLAETWLGVMKRRSQLRNVQSEDFLSCPRPTFRTSSSNRCTRIEISLLSKKFWRDEEGTSQGAKKEMSRHVGNNNLNAFGAIEEAPLQKKEESSVVDILDEVFSEKLVFIDDED